MVSATGAAGEGVFCSKLALMEGGGLPPGSASLATFSEDLGSDMLTRDKADAIGVRIMTHGGN